MRSLGLLIDKPVTVEISSWKHNEICKHLFFKKGLGFTEHQTQQPPQGMKLQKKSCTEKIDEKPIGKQIRKKPTIKDTYYL